MALGCEHSGWAEQFDNLQATTGPVDLDLGKGVNPNPSSKSSVPTTFRGPEKFQKKFQKNATR